MYKVEYPTVAIAVLTDVEAYLALQMVSCQQFLRYARNLNL